MKPLRLIALLIPGFLPAQATRPPATPAASTCWTARPADRCTGWVITEVGFEGAVATTIGPRRDSHSAPTPDFENRVLLTLGRMQNTGPRVATGFAATIGGNDPGYYLRGEVRRRHWLADHLSFEYGVGLASRTMYVTNSRERPRATGITGGVSLGLGPIGLDTRVDVLGGTGRPVVGASLGVKTAGKVMFVTSVAAGLYLLYALGTME